MSLTTRSLKRRCAAGLAFAARHHLSSIAQLKPPAASMAFGAPPG